MVRLLCFAGSTREGSYNKKLARLAQHIASANGVEAVFVDLIDYPMPLYNGDLEAKDGPPIKAHEFKALLGEYQGVFIASPEYNSSVTPLLKNTLDWVTRVRAKGESGLEVYRSRVFAISGASPGYYGAMRSLLHLRQILAGRGRRDGDSAATGAAARRRRLRGRRQPQGRGAAEAAGRRGREACRRRAKVCRAMTEAPDRLIVALDVPSVEAARRLVDQLGDSVGVYKIGLELLFSGGFALGKRACGARAPRLRRCEAARYRGDGRARHRRGRKHRRGVPHRACARPQDARCRRARARRQPSEAPRRDGLDQPRRRRSRAAGNGHPAGGTRAASGHAGEGGGLRWRGGIRSGGSSDPRGRRAGPDHRHARHQAQGKRGRRSGADHDPVPRHRQPARTISWSGGRSRRPTTRGLRRSPSPPRSSRP